MLPVVSIVGRPNVGKSTLFNALTRTRDALVADMPGVTRDRQYGICRVGRNPCVLVDTGGLVGGAEGIDYLTAQQVLQAIEESSLVLFVVSARDGLTAADEEVAETLRRENRPVLLVANKTDGTDTDVSLVEFSALGFGDPHPAAAAHRRGLDSLMKAVADQLPPVEEVEDDDPNRRRLAIIGRPNVGKSTLVNRLLGEERVMAFDMPGTTRDTIAVAYERDGVAYELIDTAGVRRRARVHEAVEKFSVVKALQAIERAHVAVLMLDGREGLTDQDMTLLAHVLEQGRGLVIAVNKWDGLDPDHREQVLATLDRKLQFVPWARRIRISALHGTGMDLLIKAVNESFMNATKDIPTPALTKVLTQAFEAHQPPMSQGRTARLRYAHMGGKLPPRIIIHGNRTDTLPDSYKRYLENTFIKAFQLVGTPVFLEFRGGGNPYQGRKNTLTERQLRKRKRLKKFADRKKAKRR
ncbi:MAG: ribosome biogenesis GTPase Der [Pseudomonadota bacterium]